MFLIYRWLDLSVLEKIFHTKTTKETSNILLKTYEGVDPIEETNLQGLKRLFELMEQGNDERVRDYFN